MLLSCLLLTCQLLRPTRGPVCVVVMFTFNMPAPASYTRPCVCCQELKLKDRECQKLHQVQEKMGEELEELTASLFEVSLLLSQPVSLR